MTKNCWNSQALAEISCYLAFAGAMLYLVRSGRYLSYVTPKLAPYLCFSAAVMVVWALSSLHPRVCRPNPPFVQPHLKQTPLEHVSLTIINLSVSQSLTSFHHHSLP